MSETIRQKRSWTANPHPDWVQTINDEADCFELASLLPLEAQSLIDTACASTALDDFGDDDWYQPFSGLCQAIAQEAQLSLMGRLQTRNDLLIFLQARLRLTELWKKNPQILNSAELPPVFIVGLPRSGTSILHELLAQDPRFRVPASWEALFPYADHRAAATESLIHRADRVLTQWCRVVPEYATMHEMGGNIPCECGLLMSPSFRGDQFSSLLQIPSFSKYVTAEEMPAAYNFHSKMLKTLQWHKTAEKWLLKAPNHLSYLPLLFARYPQARIIQTHRDPIKCMASTVNLLGYLYWMRSDQPFESSAFENIILGEGTSQRLNEAIRQRASGEIPEQNFIDSSYSDLMQDPVAALQRIYDFLELSFDNEQIERVQNYLNNKPKGKFGEHRYEKLNRKQVERERPLFAKYQQHFKVENEV